MLGDAFYGEETWKKLLAASFTNLFGCIGYKLRFRFRAGIEKISESFYNDVLAVEAIIPHHHFFVEMRRCSSKTAAVFFRDKGDDDWKYLYHADLDNASAVEVVEDALVSVYLG